MADNPINQPEGCFFKSGIQRAAAEVDAEEDGGRHVEGELLDGREGVQVAAFSPLRQGRRDHGVHALEVGLQHRAPEQLLKSFLS